MSLLLVGFAACGGESSFDSGAPSGGVAGTAGAAGAAGAAAAGGAAGASAGCVADKDCKGDRLCENGTCVDPKPKPDGGALPGSACGVCDGCCDGSTCVPASSQTDAKCGGGSEACVSCQKGYFCAQGAACFVDKGTCSPATCPTGCCAGNVCVTKPDSAACGAAGGACKKCGKGALCTGAGACDETKWSPTAKIKLTMTRLTITSGACTDPIGLPDPYVTLNVRGTYLSSHTCNDETTCDEATLAFSVINMIPSDLTSGMTTIDVTDEDTSSSDPCWWGKLQLPAPLERKAAEYALPSTGTLVDFKFRLEGM